MMTEKVRAMTPAERLAAGFCPECGESLEGLSASHHAATHWKMPISSTGSNDDAIARAKMLTEYEPPKSEVK